MHRLIKLIPMFWYLSFSYVLFFFLSLRDTVVCDLLNRQLRALRFLSHSSFIVKQWGVDPVCIHMGCMWVHVLVTCHY
ncbi:hypothetical protein VNO77_07665 [Canavalia gladiata]|uniref:Uncharacterized protein n=1 Tax=Canavalia gladiata TaxID=3824 RepID=A0AAN9MEJ2_CANGL